VQEHVLGKHRRETRQDFLSPPALTLEIHDVRLHENRAAVPENWHGLSGERQIGVLFHGQPKSFCGRLQEIAVPRRALRVELKIFHAAVMENDDLYVLPAHVDDDVWILIKL